MDKIVDLFESAPKKEKADPKEALIESLSKIPSDVAFEFIKSMTHRMEEITTVQNILLATSNRPNLLKRLIGELSPSMVERITSVAETLTKITEEKTDAEILAFAEKVWAEVYGPDDPPAG
jgi:phosphoenolpyruvate carboxylase